MVSLGFGAEIEDLPGEQPEHRHGLRVCINAILLLQRRFHHLFFGGTHLSCHFRREVRELLWEHARLAHEGTVRPNDVFTTSDAVQISERENQFTPDPYVLHLLHLPNHFQSIFKRLCIAPLISDKHFALREPLCFDDLINVAIVES